MHASAATADEPVRDRLGLAAMLNRFVAAPAAIEERAEATAPSVSSPPHHFDRFGDRILRAESKADLYERLEVAATDPEFWDQPISRADFEQARRSSFQIDHFEVIVAALGENHANVFGRGWETLASFAKAVLSACPEPPASMFGRAGEQVQLTSILYDTSVPLEMRRASLALSMAMVGSVAVFRAARLGHKLDPWLAMALAEHVAKSASQCVTLFVAAAQGQQTLISSEQTDAWYGEALADGSGVYFPLGDPDAAKPG